MKISEIHKALMTVFTQWPHVVITEPTSRMWHLAFGEIDVDTFFKAAVAACKLNTTGFPITIGQVQEALEDLLAPQELDMDAWRALMEAVRRYGNWREPEAMKALRHYSPRLADVAKSFGWQAICRWEIKDEPTNRAHFLKAYLAIKTRDRRNLALGIPSEKMLPANSNPTIPALGLDSESASKLSGRARTGDPVPIQGVVAGLPLIKAPGAS
jgi:hypothetical protein